MFDTTKTDLRELLQNAHLGRLQLPDFQRDYVWADADVRSLIASIARGFPVGALLTLEAGGEVRFRPRPLAGAPVPGDARPVELLLDGQQRITSLYQVLWSKSPVLTRNKAGRAVERRYFLDMARATEAGADIEAAILAVGPDGTERGAFGGVALDLSTEAAQFERGAFPLNHLFQRMDWFYRWRDWLRARNEDCHVLEGRFNRILDTIDRYKMPVIRLDRSNSREAICLVFEKVNVGGKKLDAFELVTAIYAADEFDLRADWLGSQGRRARLINGPNRRDVLAELASTDFLQVCTLLHTRAEREARAAAGVVGRDLPPVSCRRDALLALPLSAYRTHATAVEAGFVAAAQFLNEQKVIWRKDVPYPPQTVALAAMFAFLGKNGNTLTARECLARWFWSVALGELYGSSTETRIARDVIDVVDWVQGRGQAPDSLDEAVFRGERLSSLRIRNSAAYKALHALMMREGCRDFISGKPTDLMTFFNDQIDIHHVFPKAWCEKQGISPDIYNSILNKTPLSSASNQSIGGDAPSVYLARIAQKQGIGAEALDAILTTHRIDPVLLRADDFEAFIAARRASLSALVAATMGKPVVPGTDPETGGDPGGADDEIEEAA